MYLRHIAYPNSRYEEFSEDYFEKTNLDTLLLRIGYNQGLIAALQASGLKEDPEAGMTAAEVGEKFRHEIMITAYTLAAGGFLKFDKAHPIIKMTISMIKAAKARAKAAEKNGSQGENEPIFADVIREQLK
jgi:hypothetical protein